MAEDDDEQEPLPPEEVCDRCGAEGDEGELGLDDDLVCEDCRDNDEWHRQLVSDYRASVL